MAPNIVSNRHTAELPYSHNGNSISYLQCKSMQYNVIIIAFLGVIMSFAVLLVTMWTLNLQPEVEQLLKIIFIGDKSVEQQHMLTNVLTIFNGILYALSVFNIFVSVMLLIGVSKQIRSLFYPWLLFHGMLFGIGIYLGLFYLAAGAFVNLPQSILCMLIFALIMLIFYKTYQEVYTLFKIMDSQLIKYDLRYLDAKQVVVSSPYTPPITYT